MTTKLVALVLLCLMSSTAMAQVPIVRSRRSRLKILRRIPGIVPFAVEKDEGALPVGKLSDQRIAFKLEVPHDD